jgi:hypothetical protein
MTARVYGRDERASTDAPDPLLNAQRGVPGAERLAVYAEGYVARTRQALAEVYEAVAHVLGPWTFSELSRAYARWSPSHDYNLTFRGRDVPDFLATSPLTETLPFLPDLARLEWRVAEAFHAMDAAPVEPRALARLSLNDWERVRVRLQPSVGLVRSRWPILDIWQARRQPVTHVAIDLVNRPQRILVSRRGEQVRCELLDDNQAQALEGLLAARTLGAVCRELAGRCGDHTPPVTAWFAQWAASGLIAGCEATS